MDKRMRDIRKLIKNEGLDVLNITTGKHMNITVTDGSVVFSVVASVSPSCHRASRNLRSNLRRGIREAQEKSNGSTPSQPPLQEEGG